MKEELAGAAPQAPRVQTAPVCHPDTDDRCSLGAADPRGPQTRVGSHSTDVWRLPPGAEQKWAEMQCGALWRLPSRAPSFVLPVPFARRRFPNHNRRASHVGTTGSRAGRRYPRIPCVCNAVQSDTGHGRVWFSSALVLDKTHRRRTIPALEGSGVCTEMENGRSPEIRHSASGVWFAVSGGARV